MSKLEEWKFTLKKVLLLTGKYQKRKVMDMLRQKYIISLPWYPLKLLLLIELRWWRAERT